MLSHCGQPPQSEWASTGCTASQSAATYLGSTQITRMKNDFDFSLFFHPPYHNLFPSGERFYLPAHFSNQTSTWELDFFKSSPEPRSYDSGDGRGKFLAMPSFLPVDCPTEKALARSRKDEFGLPSCDHSCSVRPNHRTRADWGVKQMS